MIAKYLKTAYRNILTNKKISIINVLGLSFGLACTILLLSWGSHEINFDRFFENSENIYRLNFSGEINNQIIKACSSPQGVGSEAKLLFPEVKNFTRIRQQPKTSFKIRENHFYVDKGFAADPSFFSVFSFQSKIGNLENALNKKDVVVIDEYLANKCFGEINPIGNIININNHDFAVSAVIKNVPSNSHLQFHYLIPTLNLQASWQRNKWGSDNCTQYLVLDNNIAKTELDDKLNHMLYSKNDIWKNVNAKLSIEPIKEIHFSQGFRLENALKGNKQNVFMLISVAFIVLLIACANFTNMFISTALKRTKAIGVKTVNGATRNTIIKEFATEVLIYILTASVLSVILLRLMLPSFNNLTNSQIDSRFFSIGFFSIGIFIITVTLLIAGLLPGIYITNKKTSLVLKAGFKGLSSKKGYIQSYLLTFQFIIATTLIISVLLIQKQISYLKTKQLGFDKENLVYINTNGELTNPLNIQRLKTELINNPYITGITTRSCLPFELENNGFINTIDNPDNKIHAEQVSISDDYFDVMNVKFIEGRNSLNYSSDNVEGCIINLTAAKQLNLQPPYVGQLIYDMNLNNNITIKGVTEDINTKSLISEIRPCVYTRTINYYDIGIILFKVSDNYKSAIDAIKEYCQINNSSIPFEYHFLDQAYDNLYQNEIKTQKILSWFSLLAIILTSMGLLGITYFIVQTKVKEIGIRKVNGAKVTSILAMLNNAFLKWVFVSIIISWPLSYFVIKKWLENFAYKTAVSWWIFVLAGALTLIITLITVSWQSWKAASKNPVEALRYE